MTDPTLHPCARCARVQPTCCQRTDILVTDGDRARIRAHLVRSGRAGGDAFWERRAPRDASYLDDDPDDPDWRAATVAADGTRAVLVKRADGDCTFLGEAGCTLPGDVRPLVCRLYPFEYTHRGLADEDPEYCPTALVDPRGTGMVSVLGMRRAEAEVWRRDLYRELGIDARQDAPRP